MSVIEYRYRTLVFGVNLSSFLLNAIFRHHIRMYEEQDPEFVKNLCENLYCDDLVTGCDNLEGALQKAKSRLSERGFQLRKWKTNEPKLLAVIMESEKENQVSENNCFDQTYAKEKLGLEKTATGKAKVFGIDWDVQKNNFEFQQDKMIADVQDKAVAKRGILSALAKLFYPFRLVNQSTVKV